MATTSPSRQGQVLVNAVVYDGRALYSRPVSAFRYTDSVESDFDPRPGEFAFTLSSWTCTYGHGHDVLPVTTTLVDFATLNGDDSAHIDATVGASAEYYARLRCSLRPAGLVLDLAPVSGHDTALTLLTTGVGHVLNTSDTEIQFGDVLVLRLPRIDGPSAPDLTKSRIFPGRLLLHGLRPPQLLQALHTTVKAAITALDSSFRLTDGLDTATWGGETLTTAVRRVAHTIGAVGRVDVTHFHSFLIDRAYTAAGRPPPPPGPGGGGPGPGPGPDPAETWFNNLPQGDKRTAISAVFSGPITVDVLINRLTVHIQETGWRNVTSQLRALFPVSVRRQRRTLQRPSVEKFLDALMDNRQCPGEAAVVVTRFVFAPVHGDDVTFQFNGRPVLIRPSAGIDVGAGGRRADEDVPVPEHGINFVGLTAAQLPEKVDRLVAAATKVYKTAVRDGAQAAILTALRSELAGVVLEPPQVSTLAPEQDKIVTLLSAKFVEAFDHIALPPALPDGILRRAVLSRSWLTHCVVGGTPVGRALGSAQPGGVLDAHIALRTNV